MRISHEAIYQSLFIEGRGALKRELVTPADLDAAMRQQGCLSIDDVALAVLEINGHITIVPKK